MLQPKNAKAYAVFAIFVDLLTSTTKTLRDFVVEPYLNGREQGFAIWSIATNRKVAFSENRNSDHIVLYKGTGSSFSMGGNVPDDTTYLGSRCYSSDEYKEVAGAALDYLEGLEGLEGK